MRIEQCKAGELSGKHRYYLRESDDPAAPWLFVTDAKYGFWTDTETGLRTYYMTFTLSAGTERMFNPDDMIDVAWPE
ncbi:hypothetical protein MINS_03850 [Mycolicibacterium insubricum]|nr:hypothetical protein [Mycolicibacterium insubricum]MCV7082883.1 hypothetical protein [Mycolicibacterium insubricum]BBZ64956.1 hypothetical protein MINS_03850 [Mycolicibacterium insubricum]